MSTTKQLKAFRRGKVSASIVVFNGGDGPARMRLGSPCVTTKGKGNGEYRPVYFFDALEAAGALEVLREAYEELVRIESRGREEAKRRKQEKQEESDFEFSL